MGTNKTRKRILWAGALSVAIAASGVYGYNAVQAAGSNGSASTGAATAAQTGKQLISVEKAEQLALAVVKGTVKDIDLVHYKGRLAYKVYIQQSDRGTKLWIDAATGKSLGKRTFEYHDDYDRDDDYEDDRDRYPSGLIGAGKAAAAALKHAGGGTVTDVDLDEDDNRWIYDVEVKTSKGSMEVEVNALSGKIVKSEYDHDDDDQNDDHDDDHDDDRYDDDHDDDDDDRYDD
ncbi:PepSY domain-containing protein [Paenibacillus ihbetae]|uniref:Peptidase M4 n=1 Tax=Paenibacillus ihbetae TaxID=1870820 RepID=A0ABX3K319_9BACL|nr:PepSY domain-containing protein [Paenibacillus ihbetae]OOC63842.1 peptidase M4 [Paenibacillus ihbetae]